MTSYPAYVSYVGSDSAVKSVPELNRSRKKIRLQVVADDCFNESCRANFRPEVSSDVISGTLVEAVGVDISVKFCYYKSNHS